VQLIILLRRALGTGANYTQSQGVYERICEVLREEYGVYTLAKGTHTHFDELKTFFEQTPLIDRCFDVIELCMRAVALSNVDQNSIPASEAVEVLNLRLREAEVGYQFENGYVLRVESQLVHSEVVKPALAFLLNPAFKGANDEFMAAHRNYRSGDYKGCLVESLKALESTMKIICGIRNWDPEGDTASKLITTLFSNGLVPPYLQSQFEALKSVLVSGVPVARNKVAGHGQGSAIKEAPDYLAAYVLHQTAAAILFIVKAHEAKPQMSRSD
jgi:hypothetical protein